jgi:thiol-disulfide isomerase/thioredoxin
MEPASNVKSAEELAVGLSASKWLTLGVLSIAAGALAAFLLAGETGKSSLSSPNSELTTRKFVRLAAPEPVADLAFLDGEGQTRRISEWRGRTILLNLWATWCAPCKTEMPSLDRLEAKLGGVDFAVVALSLDRGGLNEPAAFFARQGISRLKLYNDATGEARIRMKASALPLTAVLNEKGEEIARLLGPADWDAPERVAELQALLGK